MQERPTFLQAIKENFEIHPICALLGPRQCGKTTLAKQYTQGKKAIFFDLENPLHLSQLDHPKLALDPLEGLIVIDEIQRRPELFTYLRVLVDEHPERQFLILGSASRDLIQQSSETLAGRIGYIELTPFQLAEVNDTQALWERGGFPKAYLAPSSSASERWRKAYIQTFLERDLAFLGFERISRNDMHRLWMMLAHIHGNILNYSELSRSLGISHTTIKRYIDILNGAFMIRSLQPWFENISKRQVKSPKIYIRDSGLLHALLNITGNLSMHPKVGASWQGFALEEIIRHHSAEDCYFWATQSQAELDLLVLKEGRRFGFEFKYTDHPKATRSLHIAEAELKLDSLSIIIPGDAHFSISSSITVQGLDHYCRHA